MRIGVPQMPRFFSMTDVKKIRPQHREYSRQVQDYFRRLFPRREWKLITDPVASPLAVDVELLYPTVEEPFYLLHTVGMSAEPQSYPSGSLTPDQGAYSELCLMLPADWPFPAKQISLSDPAAWPIWLLMELGRFPHVHHMWMSYGFMMPNTEQCLPFSRLTQFSGVLVVQFEGELGELKMSDGTTVELLMPVPVYSEEMALCDNIGTDALIDDIVEGNGGSFLVDMHRPNVGTDAYQKNK
ncbi:suppressor of fused domain protein [uncultured Megasphaera sp.]|uniref:suppressor of fused domain protein n=1 Tax=uncultured Megasphaera sp. TaxID=165188 RepID=UPI00265B5F9A|nr:suppressor of fused domain protein [uncultured Megasphaera sp.]